jgi:transposase
MTTVTVLSGPERRRRWTDDQKQRILEESLVPGASVVEVARRHDVHPNLLHLWRRQARVEGTPTRVEGEPGFVPVSIAASVGQAETRNVGAAGAVSIEVVLRNGRVLRVATDLATARMVELAAALEEQA